MKKNRFIALFFLIIAILASSCKSSETRESKTETLNSSYAKIHEVYSPYQKLNADFIVRGFLSGNSFTYNGKIIVDKSDNPKSYKLLMVVRDMIFYSPMITVDINNDQLKWKDHLANQEKSYAYTNSSILFFSNQLLPTEILIPLLTGNLPENMTAKGKNKTTEKSIQYRNLNYEVIGFFNDSVLNTLICNPTEDFHQVVYKVSGKLKNGSLRYFPENIKIILENDNYIEIVYNKVELK